MEEKYYLTEEDIKNLTIDQQTAYNKFIQSIQVNGVIYKEQLEDFDKILQNQYSNHVLSNPNSMERYLEVLAKNLQMIVKRIVALRNDAINGKRVFDQFEFNQMAEGLNVLTEFINKYLNSYHYQDSLGNTDLKNLLPVINRLQGQLQKDLQYYQNYLKEKSSAKAEFESKKAAYNKLNMFKKLLTGKKKELDNAAKKNAYYGSKKVTDVEPGMIDNPYQYDEYIENQQSIEHKAK